MYSAAEFEVHGVVQGVFFRAHAEDKARQLGLVGWVANAPAGTVIGEVQGGREEVQQMKAWLCKEGSPQSRIERCEFRNERHDLPALAYSDFGVRRRCRGEG